MLRRCLYTSPIPRKISRHCGEVRKQAMRKEIHEVRTLLTYLSGGQRRRRPSQLPALKCVRRESFEGASAARPDWFIGIIFLPFRFGVRFLVIAVGVFVFSLVLWRHLSTLIHSSTRPLTDYRRNLCYKNPLANCYLIIILYVNGFI